MSTELLPCPFCGINNEEIKNKTEYLYHDTWEISCGGCGAALSIRDYNKDTTYYESDIIAAWNRRFVLFDKNENPVYAGDKVKYKLPNWKNKYKDCYVTELRPPFYGYGLTADDDFDFGRGDFLSSEIELVKEAP